jgi:O-antigen chain-terminating methyltransferase
MSGTKTWLTVAGSANPALEGAVKERVRQQLASGKLKEAEIAYVSKTPLLLGQRTNLSKEQVDCLRRLCQSWDVDLQPFQITSHRRFLGPLIVGSKKMLFRILKPLLQSLIVKQKDFNAEVIRTLYLTGEERQKLDS